MGSQLVRALIEQRARQNTNPDGVIPEISKPIMQDPFKKTTQSTNIIEQKTVQNPITGPGGVSPSRPIQQFIITRTANSGAVLEQKNLERSEDADVTVIEQRVFTTSNATSKIIEQRNASRSIINGGPIEQTAQITNDIDIEQFDFINLIFPPCGSIRNPVDTNILIRLTNFGFAFNLATLIFKVDGIEVQNSPEFVATPLVNGVQLDYNPPENFDYSAEVNVYAEVRDTASIPNRFIFRCSFFTVADTIAPVLDNFTLCNQTDVEPDAVLEFDLIDRETGINPDTIKMSVEGVTVCSGIELTEITTVSGNGFHVRWEHADRPFRYNSNVTVAVEAEDNAVVPNDLLFLCRFAIRQSTAPEFLNFDPEPCETFVDNTTGLTFEVYGVEDGVDISTLEVRVDSKIRKVYVRPRIRRVN